MSNIAVKIKALHPGAQLPARATPGSAGYDLYACLDGAVVIGPGETQVVPTGISIELPNAGMAALVYGRSGLGVRHGIVPANCVGVVDSDYRGEIMVGLRNQSKEPYTVQPGDRIAQMVLTPVLTPDLVPAEELSPTGRSGGGFGSTNR